MEKFSELGSVASCNAQLFADSLVPHLRKRLGRLYRQTVKQQVVSIIVRLEKFRGMLARLAPHGNELKRYRVDFPRISLCEVIRETEIPSTALLDRLTRKRKPKSFCPLVLFVNYQIVPARIAGEISVDQLCFQKFFPYRLRFYLCKFRVHGFLEDLLVFLGRLPS